MNKGFFLTISLVVIVAAGSSAGQYDDKMHFPQHPDFFGPDIKTTGPPMLADDWQCSETGWIKDIHFWGGWKGQQIGTIESFLLRIYSDNPECPPYAHRSRPDVQLWQFSANQFTITERETVLVVDWYDPSTGTIIEDDHYRFFEYDVYLDMENWFWQDSGTVYWLAVNAVIEDSVTQWGWRTSAANWNHYARWSLDLNRWCEMYDPPGTYGYVPGDVDHNGVFEYADFTRLNNWMAGLAPPPPYTIPCVLPEFYPAIDVNGDCFFNVLDIQYLTSHFNMGGPPPTSCGLYPPYGAPLDLSFVIAGKNDPTQPGECEPGNANGISIINILDITCLIAYLYEGGPGPKPYAVCSGDPNCDCTVNMLDVTHLINYLYKGGPPPCTGADWLNACPD